MDIKELRIGNYVMGNKPFQLDLNTFNMMWNHWNLKKELRFEPITLTEQWAVKFGCECLVDMACVFNSNSMYKIEITPDELEQMKVHEAQNLYFVLTNKELELNVKKC